MDPLAPCLQGSQELKLNRALFDDELKSTECDDESVSLFGLECLSALLQEEKSSVFQVVKQLGKETDGLVA